MSRVEWPNSSLSLASVPETRKAEVFHTVCEPEDLLARFSSFLRALRVTAFMLRFYANCKSAVQTTKLNHLTNPKFRCTLKRLSTSQLSDRVKNVREVSSTEVKSAKIRLIVLTQSIFYADERTALLNSKPLPKKSPLRSLTPCLDENSILRVDGRLANAKIPAREKNPIIIPEKSRFCELLLDFTHKLLLHGQHQLMIQMTRQEFYIPRLKMKVKTCISHCKPCTIFKQTTRNEIMAALPTDRVEITLPFTVTGVDFAGPFKIKASMLRNAPYLKGYVCVFVCFCTKAVHLEVCSDLTTEAFFAAFTRFVGRRGLPSKVYSDNGRNFVGASKVLQREYQSFMREAAKKVQSSPLTHEIEWLFIPPGAPHMGGLWEAAVKSFKTLFVRTAGSHNFTFEELTTLMARIESVLNSRPLSALSNDPNDLVPLTAGHFLRGGPLLAIPEPPKEKISLVNRWERIKALHHQFCRRWKNEYLCELHKRRKWQQPGVEVAKNDLVVIKEDGLPPNEWRLGRIIEVHPGRDGRIRVVTVKTSTGNLVRPIVKIVVLPKRDELIH